MAAATWPIATNLDHLLPEATTCFLGFRFALDFCFMDISLEGDNLQVVRAISNYSLPGHELAQIALTNPNSFSLPQQTTTSCQFSQNLSLTPRITLSNTTLISSFY